MQRQYYWRNILFRKYITGAALLPARIGMVGRIRGTIQGIVQSKLRWVKNGTNSWVLAWDCGAGHYFQVLICRRLVLNIFPFPVSTAKFIGDFYNNGRSAAISCLRFAYSFVSLM